MPSNRAPSMVLTAGVACLCAAAGATQSVELTPAREAELVSLVEHECGACHGLHLRGGLGPPLTPDIMASRPRVFLETTIADGRAGTPMPPWSNILTRQEIAWVVDRLQRGLRDER